MKTMSEIGGMNSIAFIIFYYASLLYAYFTKRENFIKTIFPFIYSKDFEEMVSQDSKDDQGKFSLAIFGQNMRKIKEEAYNSIVKCLDVVNIVKEMNNIKLLTHIMMNQHHRFIAPLVALNINDVTPPFELSNKVVGLPTKLRKSSAGIYSNEFTGYKSRQEDLKDKSRWLTKIKTVVLN
jgi:hypothetical protein